MFNSLVLAKVGMPVMIELDNVTARFSLKKSLSAHDRGVDNGVRVEYCKDGINTKSRFNSKGVSGCVVSQVAEEPWLTISMPIAVNTPVHVFLLEAPSQEAALAATVQSLTGGATFTPSSPSSHLHRFYFSKY